MKLGSTKGVAPSGIDIDDDEMQIRAEKKNK
jgi:hypothetical protein